MYLGPSSPKVMCSHEIARKARTAEIECATAGLYAPNTETDGSMNFSKTGSPIQPSASDASVTPNCVAERYESSFLRMRRAMRARELPAAASSASCVGRTFTIANSAATKTPFAMMSAKANSKYQVGIFQEAGAYSIKRAVATTSSSVRQNLG